MNELIQELAEKSEIELRQDGAGYLYHRAWPENLEKFAELIIQECQKAADKYISDCGEVASLPEYVFHEHFGVK